MLDARHQHRHRFFGRGWQLWAPPVNLGVLRGHELRHDAGFVRLRRGAETVEVEEVGDGALGV